MDRYLAWMVLVALSAQVFASGPIFPEARPFKKPQKPHPFEQSLRAQEEKMQRYEYYEEHLRAVLAHARRDYAQHPSVNTRHDTLRRARMTVLEEELQTIHKELGHLKHQLLGKI